MSIACKHPSGLAFPVEPRRGHRRRRSAFSVVSFALALVLLALPGAALAQTPPPGTATTAPAPATPVPATPVPPATATPVPPATATPVPAATATPVPSATAVPTAAAALSLSLSVGQGLPGASLTATGTGYRPGETVLVNFGGSQVASTTANTSGSFTVSFVVPSLAPGQYTVTASGQTSGVSASAAFTITGSSAGLALSTSQGPPNTSVGVTGTGYEAGETVQVTFNGSAVASATVGTSGTFTATFTVPNVAAGAYTVAATGQTSGTSASTTFTVSGSAASLVLSPSQGAPGTTVTATGTTFQPGETIQISANGAAVASIQADNTGSFNTTFQVPSITPGQYVLTAAGQTSGATASASFTVLGASSATATPSPTITPPTAPPLVHDSQYFSQTGYRIDNSDIWNYFQSRGQVGTFGYPVSRTFTLLGCQAQIFQRQVAQVCSGQGPALMNILGPDIFPYTQVNGSTFPGPDQSLETSTPSVSSPTYATDIITFVQQNAPNTFNNQPVNFGTTFLQSISPSQAGTSDPNLLALIDLEVWGAPISQPAADPNNSNFIYQRFQRGIMMYDATIGQTQGVLLADYLKSIMMNQNVPPDLLAQAQGSNYFAQYCPGSPQWLCRPNALAATDLTYAFQPG